MAHETVQYSVFFLPLSFKRPLVTCTHMSALFVYVNVFFLIKHKKHTYIVQVQEEYYILKLQYTLKFVCAH
jgi:hypothetical protein